MGPFLGKPTPMGPKKLPPLLIETQIFAMCKWNYLSISTCSQWNYLYHLPLPLPFPLPFPFPLPLPLPSARCRVSSYPRVCSQPVAHTPSPNPVTGVESHRPS